MSDERDATEDGQPAESPDDPSRADQPTYCAVCGDGIETDDWHPVATRQNGDEEFQLYAFCSEDCREAWDSREDGD